MGSHTFYRKCVKPIIKYITFKTVKGSSVCISKTGIGKCEDNKANGNNEKAETNSTGKENGRQCKQCYFNLDS
jgi:hypothetical protein